MKRVNRDISDSFHRDSIEGVDAVLERMLKAVGGPLGMSYAEAFDVSENTIKTWRRRGAVSLRYLEEFAREHRASLDYLLRGTVQDETGTDLPRATPSYRAEDFVMVPRYDVRGSAGNGSVIHSEQVVDYLAFRSDWVRNALGVSQKDLALISVKGDSMEPTLSNGDLILIDQRSDRVQDNSIYVLQHNGDLLVKRIQRKLDGTVIVKSDNSRYEPEMLGSEAAARLIVVGRVVWSGRKM